MSRGQPEAVCCLFVGFFSAPAFIIYPKGRPVIALALERRPEISSAALLVAHEYGHYMVSRALKLKKPWSEGQAAERMAAEGLAVYFSMLVYPELPEHQHYFLSRKRLRECRETFRHLSHSAGEEDLQQAFLSFFLRQPSFPGGCRTYLAYRLLEDLIGRRHNFDQMVKDVFENLSPFKA